MASKLIVVFEAAFPQAFIRVGNLQADLSGAWSFDVKAEQKSSCHLADPPPLAEISSFLVRSGRFTLISPSA